MHQYNSPSTFIRSIKTINKLDEIYNVDYMSQRMPDMQDDETPLLNIVVQNNSIWSMIVNPLNQTLISDIKTYSNGPIESNLSLRQVQPLSLLKNGLTIWIDGNFIGNGTIEIDQIIEIIEKIDNKLKQKNISSSLHQVKILKNQHKKNKRHYLQTFKLDNKSIALEELYFNVVKNEINTITLGLLIIDYFQNHYTKALVNLKPEEQNEIIQDINSLSKILSNYCFNITKSMPSYSHKFKTIRKIEDIIGYISNKSLLLATNFKYMAQDTVKKLVEQKYSNILKSVGQNLLYITILLPLILVALCIGLISVLSSKVLVLSKAFIIDPISCIFNSE